jgi:hypothetical protein
MLDVEQSGRGAIARIPQSFNRRMRFRAARDDGNFNRAIDPTLLQYSGSVLAASNAKDDDPENFLWRLCNEPELGFSQSHATVYDNPLLPIDEIERLRATKHPLVWQSEYLAEFTNFAGEAFFRQEWLLVDGQPVPYPKHCDQVFAIIDCAAKTGQTHDATACIWIARDRFTKTFGTWILDWDIVQIEGASLEHWLPIVFKRGEELARQCGARMGFTRAMIEDASAGQVLLQQARNRGWPAEPLPSGFVALGKDVRALDVSGYVAQGLVKLTEHAFNKTSTLKGVTRNHLLSQIAGFCVGDKDAAKRADDLLDCFTGAVAMACGNQEGF